MKHEKRYYKIGEFAEMCGTKKSTLQHYARVGVLQPALIGENGYFYYELSQIYIFEAIYAMRVMQIPLEEIKEYLKERNPGRCVEMLKNRLAKLEEQKKVIERTENLIKRSLEESEAALSAKCDEFEFVTFHEDAPYYAYTFHDRLAANYRALKNARKWITHCRDNGYNESLRVSEFVMPKHVRDGSFEKTYGAFKMFDENSSDRDTDGNIFIRPKGIYVTAIRHSSGTDIPSVYRALVQYAVENGYEPCGIAFEEDLMNQMIDQNRDNYLVQCYVQVRKV